MKYIIILAILAILISGCAAEDRMQQQEKEDTMQEEDSQEMPTEREDSPITLKELKAIEVKEYDGKKLDSAEDVLDLSIKGPQYVDIDTYRLEVSGIVENPKQYAYEEALAHQKYSKVITLHCVTGWDATILWEGILLKDLFEEVNPKPEANTVIFYAADGYTTSLPLDYIIDNNIMLADKMNNITLVPERGFPFELVAEDKLGYKWIKWVTKIELSDDPGYEGYWESRGYSNKADI